MDRNYEISTEQILIKTEIPFCTLLEMEISQKINEHAVLRLRVLVNSKNQEDILNVDWSSSKVSIWQKKDKNEPLFFGSIDRLVCQKENQLLILEIKGVGETKKLDRRKKRQSFQNVTMTYNQVIQKVVKDYEYVGITWNIDKDKQIGEPLIQYDETDWEFLTRLCSHFHKPIIADLRAEKIAFVLGMSHETNRIINEKEIQGEGFDSVYYWNGCCENSDRKPKTFYLDIESGENWKIGDMFIHHRGGYRVCSRNIIFKHGELTFTYRLGMEGLYYQKKIYNEMLTGVRLEGIVRDIKREKVYLQLEIDEEERADYPWIWAPETNNLCYCMPEVDTKVVLYLPSPQEKDGRAILSTVKNAKNNIYLTSYKKEFVTKFYKKLCLYPDRLLFEGKDAIVFLSIEDQKGIRICSNIDISITAVGEILCKGKNVIITAPVKVACMTNKSNVELCRDINLYACEGVRTLGIGSNIAREKNLNFKAVEGQDTEHWQVSFFGMAAVPVVDFKGIKEKDDIIDLFACGGIPKIASGAATVALSEVMGGEEAQNTSFPDSFISMENCIVKGGHMLPDE